MRKPRSVRRAALIALAFFLVPIIIGGATLLVRRHNALSLARTSAGETSSSPRRLPTTQRPLALVVAGNHGTEITDTLPVLELLAASEAFEVRIVAPERVTSPFFNAGLDFVPDLAFADLEPLGREPALIVVPYILRWQTEDAAVVDWLRQHAGTTVLSICAGAEVVAAAGLFDGYRATANDANLDVLPDRHRAVSWQRDVRWVHDRERFSSGTLAAGLDATLAAIAALAGRDAAEHAIRATAYPHARFLDDPRAVSARLDVRGILEAAFRWETTSVGVVIDDGVSEAAVAGMLEAYTATLTAHTTTLATTRRIVRTKHGFGLVAREATDAARDLDVRVVLAVDERRYGYDVAVEQVQRTHGGPMARMASGLMNYPTSHLQLHSGLPVGVTMALRAVGLGALAAGLLAWLLKRYGASTAPMSGGELRGTP